MANKEAIEILKKRKVCRECVVEPSDCDKCNKAFDLAIKALEDSGWIPVKIRQLSAEEVKEVNEKYDVDLDEDEAWCICSPLPADAQEVLITTKYGDVVLTEFCEDYDSCWFDGYEDKGDVLAWMPLPKPYTKEETT